jgi:Asp-tRNA(Asn)/Glu-tRNA(Gln) amidotransferase A subunit family amidase
MAKPLWALNATETANLIRKKQISARETVAAHLARLDAMNPKLNAVVRPLPVLGFPSLALPVGMHEGQPMGIQIVSRRFREDLCLAAGEIIEFREPPVTPIDVKW